MEKQEFIKSLPILPVACVLGAFASAATVWAKLSTFSWELGIIAVPVVTTVVAVLVGTASWTLGLALSMIRISMQLRVALGTYAGTLFGLLAGQYILDRSSAYAPNAPTGLPFWTLAAFVLAGAIAGAVGCTVPGKPNT